MKHPWDIPTSELALYEAISAKLPEERTPIEALAKKYVDVCAQTVDERDLNIQRAQKAELQCDGLRSTILLLLDHVDYANHACRVNEMVGAVLPPEVLQRARAKVMS